MTPGSESGQGLRLPRSAHRLWGCLLGWVGVAGSLVAQEPITSAMSAPVSYQFAEPLGRPGQEVMSTLVSYQFYEWPGNDVLGLLSSRWVSYRYPALSGPQIVVHGQVQAADGTPLAGATVSAQVGTAPVGTVSTDAGGHYALALGAGPWVLRVGATGYEEAARALTLTPATARQDFQLAPRPAPPAQTRVNRPAPEIVLPPIGQMAERLRVFNGDQFVDILPGTPLSRDRMTVVLTHGWVLSVLGWEPEAPGVEGWPTQMARAMWAAGVTAEEANILAWDWRYAAEGPLPREEMVPGEGVLLGGSLQTLLGSDYSHSIHFLGHSLGALVNAAAGNYLKGHRTAQQPVSPTPWTAVPMHFTLFDQAEVARVMGLEVIFDGLTLGRGREVVQEVLRGASGGGLLAVKLASKALRGWTPSLPVEFTWADNYISAVGFYLPETLNVALQKGVGLAALRAAEEPGSPLLVPFKTFAYAHGYAAEWYSLSIAHPTHPENPLGFKRSVEYSRLPGVRLGFPPPIEELAPGDAFHQVPLASDELALEPLPLRNVFQLIVPFFGNGVDTVVQVAHGTIQVAGDVVAEIRDTVEQAAAWMRQGFDFVSQAALEGREAVLNLVNSAALRLRLRTGAPPGLQRLALQGGQASAQAGAGAGGPPRAWLLIEFPANATAMAFDFMVEADPVDDVLVCGLGTNNLFSLEAKYIPTNTLSASRLMDVSSWAGTTNELFFGFLGGTSSNATLIIENIRFYSVSELRLDIALAGQTAVLSWPRAATAQVLETTPSLSASTWEIVTNAPVILGDRYVLTNLWSDQTRFFRLRQR